MKRIKSLLNNFINGLKALPKKVATAIKNFFVGVYEKRKNRFIENKEAIVKSKYQSKLSYLIPGLGNILQSQIVRGIIYILVDVLFVLFFIQVAIPNLSKFDNLGDVAMIEIPGPGKYPIKVIQDQSVLILLFSVVSLVAIFAFIKFYFAVGRETYKNQLLIENGKRPNTIKEDFNQLLNEKYHLTVLFLPAVGVILFTILPLIFMILIAFTNFDRQHIPPGNLFTWVGFKNFRELLQFSGRKAFTFRSLLGWTFIWAFFATFTNYFGGMFLAMLINRKRTKGKKMWRGIFVLTIAVPQFVSLLLISQMIDSQGPGMINVLLQNIGLIDKPVNFLKTSLRAKTLVIVVNMWVGIPYTMLITTGLLMNVPSEMYEAAQIEGANKFQMFRYITFPYMLFATAPYLITQFIGNINSFNVIYLLTGGGPSNIKYHEAGETDLLVTWLFNLSVTHQDYNLAATIGIIIFIICATSSLIVFNLTGSVKREEDFQ